MLMPRHAADYAWMPFSLVLPVMPLRLFRARFRHDATPP